MRNNNVTLTGNLGRDPQVRQAGEHKVVKMSLCVAGGKASQWFRLTAFDDVATECEAFRPWSFRPGRRSSQCKHLRGRWRAPVRGRCDCRSHSLHRAKSGVCACSRNGNSGIEPGCSVLTG